VISVGALTPILFAFTSWRLRHLQISTTPATAPLAERAGMSRSTFALKFKETVGKSPMDYLTRWRMLLAGDRLTTSSDPISVIALSLGYESESAFSTAFKRTMGCSPRQYSRGRTPASPSRSEEEAIRVNRLEPVAV